MIAASDEFGPFLLLHLRTGSCDCISGWATEQERVRKCFLKQMPAAENFFLKAFHSSRFPPSRGAGAHCNVMQRSIAKGLGILLDLSKLCRVFAHHVEFCALILNMHSENIMTVLHEPTGPETHAYKIACMQCTQSSRYHLIQLRQELHADLESERYSSPNAR